MKAPAIALALIGSTWCSVAHAHCEFVTPDQAERAAELIKHAAQTIQFCEPCGDKAPGMPRQIRTAIAWRVERSVDNVLVDGDDIDQALDLASTYIQSSDRRYQNLATIVGCNNTRTQFLKVEDETPNGVMIVADTDQPPPAPVTAPPAPAPQPTYVTMPPAIVMIPAPSPSIWPGVIAGGGGASAIWAAWAVLTTRRRRRGMTPRAANL
jgi:hypothetical protein